MSKCRSGWCDIEPEMVAESVDKLIEIIDEINQKFPGAIRKQDYWISTNVHKERWLPEF